MFLPYNPALKLKSRALRKAGIRSEIILWKHLRADNFLGYSFQRQKPILHYIVDFYCKELNLVIEIDGSSHSSEKAQLYDTKRDRALNAIGLRVLRIPDKEVKVNIENVLRIIEQAVREITPPAPIKEGATGRSFPLSEEAKGHSFPLSEEAKGSSFPLSEGDRGSTINTPLVFSPEAQAVFDAGRELWRYYHSKPNVNVNASLYDIKEYFQGRNEKGKMNNKSTDETYMNLIGNLREKLKLLAEKIEPKIYEYGFLKQ